MSGAGPGRMGDARALAEAFDRSFTVARPPAPPTSRDYLLIRIGGDPHAIALLDLAELVPLGKLTALPGSPSECLGLAGVRGAAVPVYDLRVLLGYAAGGEAAAWLAIPATDRIAFVFDSVEGFLRLSDETEGAGAIDAAPPQRHVRHVLGSADAVLPVLDTGSILVAIRKLVPRSPRVDA